MAELSPYIYILKISSKCVYHSPVDTEMHWSDGMNTKYFTLAALPTTSIWYPKILMKNMLCKIFIYSVSRKRQRA